MTTDSSITRVILPRTGRFPLQSPRHMGSGLLEIKSERGFWKVAVAGFAVLSVLMYLPVLTGRIPFPRDIVLQFAAWNGMARSEAWQPYADIGDLVTAFYPARAFAARSVHEGTLPLWNPYFLGGAPFLASAQSSL